MEMKSQVFEGGNLLNHAACLVILVMQRYLWNPMT